jgi:hypothetical protein
MAVLFSMNREPSRSRILPADLDQKAGKVEENPVHPRSPLVPGHQTSVVFQSREGLIYVATPTQPPQHPDVLRPRQFAIPATQEDCLVTTTDQPHPQRVAVVATVQDQSHRPGRVADVLGLDHVEVFERGSVVLGALPSSNLPPSSCDMVSLPADEFYPNVSSPRSIRTDLSETPVSCRGAPDQKQERIQSGWFVAACRRQSPATTHRPKLAQITHNAGL